MADDAQGVWEALDVVYPKAQTSSACGILGGLWREGSRGEVTQREGASERTTGRPSKRRVSEKPKGDCSSSEEVAE